MKSCLIIGGAGYCGSYIVEKLLKEDWKIEVFDTFWYETKFQKHKNLSLVRGDVRDKDKITRIFKNHENVIHLACISNDASFVLDERLSTSVNLESFEPLVAAAKNSGIKRFIFASSSSVYGVSKEKDVKEDHPLLPITFYNKYKGMCEAILNKYTSNEFSTVIFRPATVCGYSSLRQRLDLSVNILTNFAVNKNKIIVFGGSQIRPNLHINDYYDLCKTLLIAPKEKIHGEVFNYGAENMSISKLAEKTIKVVKKHFNLKNDIELEVQSSDDIRSYHINSDKIKKKLGISPKFTVDDAISDLCQAFENKKILNSFDDNIYYNVQRMRELKVK
jgi:nucleoside-diphosphate-sugar epimerase